MKKKQDRNQHSIKGYTIWDNYQQKLTTPLPDLKNRFRFNKSFLTMVKFRGTVKLGDKERFDKEQIGIKEPFPMTNCQFTS